MGFREYRQIWLFVFLFIPGQMSFMMRVYERERTVYAWCYDASPPPPFLHHFLFTDEGKCFDGCCIFERESIPLLFVITAEPEGMTAEP